MHGRRLAGALLGASGLILSAGLAAGAGAQAATTAPSAPGTSVSVEQAVVVLGRPGQAERLEKAATALGLTVTRNLPIISGFAASGPAQAVEALRSVPGVVSVTPDAPVEPASMLPAPGLDPADTGSMSSVTRMVGAQAAWAQGYTGAGVDVAVIDTGVSPVAGLSTSGKIAVGPDLSFGAPAGQTPGVDAYGHGTFMAGIIAGKDAGATAAASKCATCLNKKSGYSDTTMYVGVAPDARIVNVKVGSVDGATDVSQVIAAIDWVTQHAHDPGFNIKVLSLSYGTASRQSYLLDPLAQAAEQAWKHGIVVVAAAGNDGLEAGPLADPAYDPYLLAVGANDANGTLDTADDMVPEFAQHGIVGRLVDVIAPGAHLVGLRVPGSYIDSLPDNAGKVGTRFQRGSGTSQATAVVSGIVALLAQKYPAATPDQLKGMVIEGAVALPAATAETVQKSAREMGLSKKETAVLVNAVNEQYSGHGIANAANSLGVKPGKTAPQTHAVSTGTGTLDGARGGLHLTSDGIALEGQKDIFGKTYDSAAMAKAHVAASAWTGGVWNGSRWTGDGWSGSRWSAAEWADSSWTGSRWSGSRWSGMVWDGSRWSGNGWSGSRWRGNSWVGSRWSSAGWA